MSTNSPQKNTDVLNDKKAELQSLLRKLETDQLVTKDIKNTIAEAISRLYNHIADEIREVNATLKQMILVQSQIPNLDFNTNEGINAARDRALDALGGVEKGAEEWHWRMWNS
jgi:hypothetical protein